MTKRILYLSQVSVLFIIGIFLTQSCKTPPTADFSIDPAENPEAGDTIFFNNQSLEALSYKWDFGNGKSSEEDSPYTFYDTKGSYIIKLIATNEDGSDSIAEAITIFDPTVLGFYVYMPDSITPLENCNVWVYDNETDWDNFDEPKYFELTDRDGLALFNNLEDITYYIIMYKEVEDGLYITGGYTQALTLNNMNLYAVVSDFIPAEELKSVKVDKTFKSGWKGYSPADLLR